MAKHNRNKILDNESVEEFILEFDEPDNSSEKQRQPSSKMSSKVTDGNVSCILGKRTHKQAQELLGVGNTVRKSQSQSFESEGGSGIEEFAKMVKPLQVSISLTPTFNEGGVSGKKAECNS